MTSRIQDIELLTRAISNLAIAKIQLAESKYGKNEENVANLTLLINELIEKVKKV